MGKRQAPTRLNINRKRLRLPIPASNSPAARLTERAMSQMRRFLSFRDFDWTLLGMVLLLCTISVFEIYSATLHTKYTGFHTKQIYWIVGGLAAMFIFAKIDYHKLIDYVPWAYGVCLVALVAVLAVGQKVLGARRWIKLGPMHFQPSEWVKLVLILAVARYFANLGASQPQLERDFEGL